jgi:superfamily I DNA/RNA helicase
MTISQSKGLTVDTTILVGLEEWLIPFEHQSANSNEERRLLYVALTRARTVCIATMATFRSGQTARIGGGSAGLARDKSSLVSDLSFGSPIGPTALWSELNAWVEIEMMHHGLSVEAAPSQL